MAALVIALGNIVYHFRLDFGQAREAAAVEQLQSELAPVRFSLGVVQHLPSQLMPSKSRKLVATH